MKKIIFCCLILAKFSTVFSQNQKAVIDKVNANVGQEIILLSELEEQYSYATSRQSKVPADLKCQIFQEIITQKLLVNQARLDSVVVTDEEIQAQVDARFERIVAQMGGDESKFQEFYGVTVDVMRDQVSTDMRNQIVGQKMQQQVMESVHVTPKEVQAFFMDIPKDSLPYFNSEVEIREIVMKPTVNSIQRKIASDKATDLRNRILKGEGIGDLAKKYSEDPGSALANGDLGFVKRGTFVPEFEAAAYNLEPGQISELVESPFGFHIIKLLERRGNSIHTQHILIKPDITKEDLALTKGRLDSLKTQIEAGKMTFSEAVKKYGDKNSQSFNNDGRVTNTKSGNTYFELTDLDTDTYFAIDPLESGKMTTPIEFKDESGEKFFRLVMLVSRSKPHKASLKSDYNKIQQACLEQKKASYMSVWMAEKSKSTFIKIDPSLIKTCPELQMLENSGTTN
jgi:peptidyl-prolyl cis-trans isomerase SurA